MKRHVTKLVSVALATLALGMPMLAHAGEEAQGFIRTKQARVTELLHQSPSATRDKQIASVLDGMLDYEKLARDSLAQHWNDLGEQQRKDFTDLLKRLVQRNYERNIKNIQDYQVDYLGEENGGEAILVHTRATSKTDKREEPVSIDYKLEQADGGFRVYDIITEGSSLVNNYKHQFHRIIQKDGFDALMKRMKDKLAKGQGSV